jgi:hypothetical protein
MNMHERLIDPAVMMPGPGASSRSVWFRLLPIRLAAWVSICADHYASAAAYDDLSRLSDTQLKHRGLSRDILARDLSEWRN